MKKTLLITSLFLSVLTGKAQQILNGDFEAYLKNPRTGITSFNNWNGNASNSTSMTGNPTNSVQLKASIDPVYINPTCIAYDKNGRCISYSLGTINSYILNINSLSQIVPITQMPTLLTGNYQFSATKETYTGIVIASGNLNGVMFKDTLILTPNNTGQQTSTNIGTKTEPCSKMVFNNSCNCLEPVNQCATNPNTIQIIVKACENCPVLVDASTENTSLIVDNLSLGYAPVATNNNSENSTFNIFPNPASNAIYFDGKVEIYDLKGQLISQGENSIVISNLLQGIYLAKNESGSFVKFVKE